MELIGETKKNKVEGHLIMNLLKMKDYRTLKQMNVDVVLDANGEFSFHSSDTIAKYVGKKEADAKAEIIGALSRCIREIKTRPGQEVSDEIAASILRASSITQADILLSAWLQVCKQRDRSEVCSLI